MTTRSASREDRVTELVEELHDGVSLLTTTEGWLRFLATAARFHRYSFWNTMAILCQRPDATRVAGYRTWQRLGRQVRRGEHGIRILAPCIYRVPNEDTDGDPRHVVRGWRVVTVFDLAQTDGDPLPDAPVTILDGDAPAGLLHQLRCLIHADGYGFALAPLPDGAPTGALGVTDHVARRVTVRDDLPGAQQAKTAAHELAHVRLHPSHGTDRATAEIEAESVAFVVCGGGRPRDRRLQLRLPRQLGQRRHRRHPRHRRASHHLCPRRPRRPGRRWLRTRSRGLSPQQPPRATTATARCPGGPKRARLRQGPLRVAESTARVSAFRAAAVRCRRHRPSNSCPLPPSSLRSSSRAPSERHASRGPRRRRP